MTAPLDLPSGMHVGSFEDPLMGRPCHRGGKPLAGLHRLFSPVMQNTENTFMHIRYSLVRDGARSALTLLALIALTGCVTVDPAQQRAAFEKEIKASLEQTNIQLIHPYAVANMKSGYLPESGEFTGWGWPGNIYFGEKLIAQVQIVEAGFAGKRAITGSFDTKDIRSVSRARSSDGYDAIILNMDDNIRYYIIPFGAASVTPFGEVKDYVAFTEENGKYQNSQTVDMLLAKVANIANPRPTDAAPQLVDKQPVQFVKEAKVVEGVLQEGSNTVEIDGKSISLVFEMREITRRSQSMAGFMLGEAGITNPFAAKAKVPMLGYSKPGASGTVMLHEINPSKVSFAVAGVAYAATIVHAKDGSWRYRVQIPEPAQ